MPLQSAAMTVAATPSFPVSHQRRIAHHRLSLGALVLAWGVQAIVTQSLLLREALVLMYGSELALGIVLFAWLLGVSLGAGTGGWLASRLARAHAALVVVLLALSAAACVELWIFRGARSWLGVETGELLPLWATALASLLFVTPASSFVGMAFPLACCITSDQAREPAAAGALGSVYALESLGSLAGGALFSFWAVEHLKPIETTVLCGAIMAAASAAFLATSGCERRVVAGLTVLAAAALGTSLFAGPVLDRHLTLRRWRNIAPGYELCAEAESKYQNLAIGRRSGQFTLYANGHVAADFPDPYTFVPLAHSWMCQHPSPRRVLVLGGGAEGLLAEILRYPIEGVDYVEPDARQIELIEPYLANPDREALSDKRVTVHHLDARHFIKTQRERFDLVIARLPEPTSVLHARFYTDEFTAELRRAMTPQSVLCTSAFATPADLPPAAADYLASIRATLQRHFAFVTVGWGNPAQILAATAPGIVSTDPAVLISRYERHGIHSALFDPLWFHGAVDWLDPEKVKARAEQLEAARDIEISSDLRPAITMQRLALWERMTSGPSGHLIEWLRSVTTWQLILAVLVMAAGTLVVCRSRTNPGGGSQRGEGHPWAAGIIVWSVGTTGFATMALSIVWLFVFQSLYGYVYQRIGWIVALFMGGLVIGCSAANWQSKRVARSGSFAPLLRRRLILVDLLIALLALAAPVLPLALGAVANSGRALVLVEWAVSTMVALTGVLGGAAFALAGRLQLSIRRELAKAAGSVDAADHAGACTGALLTGILLVPVFGIPATAFFLAATKLGSAVLLLWVRSPPTPEA
ncbi:MAG: hypothetical protein AB1486_27115 [Planctomycetota bacterium]